MKNVLWCWSWASIVALTVDRIFNWVAIVGNTLTHLQQRLNRHKVLSQSIYSPLEKLNDIQIIDKVKGPFAFWYRCIAWPTERPIESLPPTHPLFALRSQSNLSSFLLRLLKKLTLFLTMFKIFYRKPLLIPVNTWEKHVSIKRYWPDQLTESWPLERPYVWQLPRFHFPDSTIASALDADYGLHSKSIRSKKLSRAFTEEWVEGIMVEKRCWNIQEWAD